MDKINPTLDDIYSNQEESIEGLVNKQNKIIQEKKKYKLKLIEELKKLQENNSNIKYSENMTIEELEEILKSIKK